ncbi:MAG: hypothetical protein R3C42_05350 [Parvularculaceae bacterium]|nr:hypothetical protein [Parvularculaceae bacterium]
MKILHRISALLILLFIIAHVANHVSAVFGVETYQAFAATLRKVYRSEIGEPLLIALLGVQLISGAALALASSKREGPRPLLSAVELIAAGLFAAFILIHLTAIAMTRYYFGVQTDFFWIAELFRPGPLRAYIVAFHFIGIVAVMTHVGVGAYYFCRSLGAPAFGRRLGYLFAISGVLSAAVAVAAYSGAFFNTGV